MIRFSIGFQNKWGHRRQKVSLSYQHIQNYSRMANRSTLSNAIQHALQSNYIRVVEKGYFDRNAGKASKAAVYAIKWLYGEADYTHGWKNVPEDDEPPERSEMRTGNSSKNVPEKRSEKRTDIEIKQRNKTLKQQKTVPAEAAVSFEELKRAGLDERAARAIASRYPFDRIERQIQWIDERSIRRNRLGMLRRAIEEKWTRPESVGLARGELGQPNIAATSGTFEQVVRNIERRFSGASPTS